MSKFTEAVALDIEQKLEDASAYYEEVIREADAPLDAYINLACLYWQCTDYGFWSGLQLDIAFVHKAGNRMYEVLEEAETIYLSYPEVAFWKKYFDFTTIGDPPFLEFALNLVDQPNSNLIPYFHIYDQSRDERYAPFLHDLYSQIKDQKTTKNRYILSLIDNLL